jgi:hypothetical protein
MAREMDDWLVKGIHTLMDGTYTPRFLKRYYTLGMRWLTNGTCATGLLFKAETSYSVHLDHIPDFESGYAVAL